MNGTLVNLEYNLENTFQNAVSSFLSIWKVDTDDRYVAFHPEGMKYPGIFITLSGKGELSWGLKPERKAVTLDKNTFFVLDKEQGCSYYCPAGHHWEFYFISFSDTKLFQEIGLEINSCYTVPDSRYARQNCESIIDEILNKDSGYRYQVNVLFHNYLITSKRLISVEKDKSSTRIKKVIRWMNHNFDKTIEVDALVAMSEMSRTLFFNKFKKETGVSPIQYFINIKLDSSRLILATTTLKITEIASLLAFYDEFYFSKMFKKRFGISPTRYRKKSSGSLLNNMVNPSKLDSC